MPSMSTQCVRIASGSWDRAVAITPAASISIRSPATTVAWPPPAPSPFEVITDTVRPPVRLGTLVTLRDGGSAELPYLGWEVGALEYVTEPVSRSSMERSMTPMARGDRREQPTATESQRWRPLAFAS